MKRYILTIIVALIAFADANAVLKEKDLQNTLSILRTELTRTHREMSEQADSQKVTSERTMKKLITVLQQSQQNALMLYSQKLDYVFDLTYACHEATEQYRYFRQSQLPFQQYFNSTKMEIARYDSLIVSLKKMPTMMLSEKAKVDRNVCLTLATNIKNNLEENNEGIKDYIKFYNMAEEKLRGINDYANHRYNDIQTSIFKNGGDDYLTILADLPGAWNTMKTTVEKKYTTSGHTMSQWDSRFIFGLFGIIVFYAIVASLLNLGVIMWLMPKRFRTEEFMKKRPCIIMASTTVTFAIILGIVRASTSQNFIIMASNLLVEYAWLLGVILISLLLRLDAAQIKSAFRIYSPLMVVGFLVIAFRIILIPNELVNLIFPPILLICSLWQWNVIRRHNKNIPKSDMFYTYVSLIVFIGSVVCSWMGYTLMSVQALIWWIMQLTCILTIACVSRWIKNYGKKKKYDEKAITQTWLFNMTGKVLLPVMGVGSVMISIYWAADVFNLSDLCWRIFTTNFVDLENLKLSILKLAVVVALWFFSSYASTTSLALLRTHFSQQDPTTADSRSMMAKNVIQVVIWGAWALISFSILGVSFAWLLVVTGGLSTGIGFASKDIIENIYYGISLMAGRIKVGDLIECDGVRGKVASISYTSTLLEAIDGSVIAFQNSQLFTKNYKNLTRNHGYVLSVIPFGVGYGSNIKEVCAMVEKAVKDLHHPLINAAKTDRVVFTEFGDSSVNLKLITWVDVVKQTYVESDIKRCIYDTLNANGIEIPFPQQEILIKNEEIRVKETANS